MLADLGGALAAAGHEVRAICGDRSYVDPGRRFPRRESIDGVLVDRVSSTAFGRGSRVGRLLDYATFALGAIRRLAFGPRFDAVVSLTTPPLIGLVGAAAARVLSNLTPGSRHPLSKLERGKGGEVSPRRPRSILWSMDVYPELAFRLGAIHERSLAGRLLSRLSTTTYRWSDAIVALGPSMAKRIESALSAQSRLPHPSPLPPGEGEAPDPRPAGEGGPPKLCEGGPGEGALGPKLTVIPNWADGDAIRPRPIAGHPLRKEWGWENRFVVLYAGNLGLAHEFETVLGAAVRLRGDRSILLAFVGAGPRLSEARRRSGELGLENVEFRPPLLRSRLGELLTAGDLHLATLRPEAAGLLVPSKIYGILSSGRPVLYVGPGEGEIFEIVNGSGCGAAVSNGDVDGAAGAIRSYAASPGKREIDGRKSRELFDREFARTTSLAKWVALIEDQDGS